MSRGHVCMVVKNRLSNDARVKKEVKALVEDGWRITLAAMPEKGAPEYSRKGPLTVIRPPMCSRRKEQLREKLDTVSGRKDPTIRAKLIRAIRKNRLRRYFAELQRDIPFEMKLRRIALESRADIYHANDLDTLDICGRAAKKNGARLVYDSHELWLESSRYLTATPLPEKLWLKRVENRYVSQAEAVISVTPLRGGKMMEMYPSIKRMEIIENAPERMEKLPEKGTLRRMAGIPEDVPIALYQGVICPERGLENLVRTAALCRDLNTRFVIIGMDAWQCTLHRMVEEASLEDKVTILPPVPSEELPGITVDADMGFILFRNTCLNHYYSLPNKLYEYMMAGVPIIASDFPELRKVIQEVGSGLTVDPASPASIFEAVKTITEDPQRRRNMAEAGRKAALERYNWKPQRDKLVKLYREIR